MGKQIRKNSSYKRAYLLQIGGINERTRESLEQFFDYQLADIKEKAMDIQDETQNAIDSFVEDFNINENE